MSGSDFNFGSVGEPVASNYVKPGFWKLAPKSADLVQPVGKKPYLLVEFGGSAGILKEKFFLTPEALGRLQYLHTRLYGKKLEKDFSATKDPIQAIAEYFKTVFAKKEVALDMIVGGQESADGKVYANLPFTNFVVDSADFEEGAFEKGSTRYNDVVKKNPLASSNVPTSNDAILAPDSDDDDLPF